MNGFLESFAPLFKKYRSESILIALALIIVIISSLIFFQGQNTQTEDNEDVIFDQETNSNPSTKIMVDVAGAVNNPGVYEATIGSRLKDIINLSKGLSPEADYIFFQRNFNLARFVGDQEKIYIPTVWEVNSGVFTENARTLDYNQPSQTTLANDIIDVNTASLDELDSLPGIGQVTAKKIIDNRPYNTIDDLIVKKVVKKNIFENIKNLISI